MRIVSKFKDYYDGIMAYGMDLDLQYIRSQYEEGADKAGKDFPYIQVGSFDRTARYVQPFMIGFCGEIHPAVSFVNYVDMSSYKKIHSFAYNENHVESYMAQKMNKDDLHTFQNATETKRAQYDNSISLKSNTKADWKDFFRIWRENIAKRNFDSMFDKCPICVVEYQPSSYNCYADKIIYNPILRNYNFGKVYNSMEAYQKIRMWISNQVSSPPKNITYGGKSYPHPMEMSNEDTAARLGHGDKYSFRTPPGKKKRKQK